MNAMYVERAVNVERIENESQTRRWNSARWKPD